MAGKIVIVLSDLHVGAGFFRDGNGLEDFTSDAAFAELLRGIARESESAGHAAELIVNGDLGEFLQTPTRADFDPRQVYPPEDYRDMGAPASAQKLRDIIAGHPLLFDALRDWLRAAPPQRRLVVTKGNHDPQWQWPEVQNLLRQTIGAAGDNGQLVEFPAVGVARDGLYVEHGNQYTEAANRFTNFAAPFAPNDPTQLETPWGSKFVIEFFNFVERDRYYVDGVKPYSALVWYALKYDPPFAFRTLVALLRAAPKLVGIRDEIMDAWLTNVQNNSQRAADRYQSDQAYRVEVNTFVAHALDAVEPEVRIRAAVTGDEDSQQMARQLMQEQDSGLTQAADRLAQAHQAAVVLFGHTHRPVNQILPSGARYINTGTWTWMMDFASASDEQWRDLFANPDRYASRRMLNYARIDYDDAGVPSAQLLEFQPTSAPPIDAPGHRPNGLERLVAFIKRLFGVK